MSDETMDLAQLGELMKSQSQAALVAKLVIDTLKDLEKAAKGGLQPNMEALGSTQQVVKAADGVKVGMLSLCGGDSKATVVDEKAVLAHVLEHYPSEIVQVVRDSFVKVLLKRADDIGEPIDMDGRVIPGIEFVETTKYLRSTTTTPGKERIAAVLADAEWMRQLPGSFSAPAPRTEPRQ